MSNFQGGFRNPIIHGNQIIDGTIGSGALADGAVIEAKLADLAVAAGKLQDEAVAEAKLADKAVTTVKLDDLAVTTAKIGLLAVGSAQIDDLAVTSAKIKDLTALLFRTATSGERLEIDGTSGESFIRMYNTSGVEVGRMGYDPTGFGINILGIKNTSGIGSILLDAAGSIQLTAEGSAGSGVIVTNPDPQGGIPGKPFVVESGSGSGFRVWNSNSPATPTWAFESDTDTGIINEGSNSIGFVTAGSLRMQIGGTNVNFGGDSGAATGHASIAHNSAGTQTDPVYTFTGAGNYGMYYGSGGHLRFTINGTYRLEIDSNGDLVLPETNVIRWDGTTGPVGLEFLGEGRLYYRSNPNTLTFEDGSGTEIFGFDYDNGHGWMESPQTTTNSGLAAWRHDNFAASGSAVYDFLPLISTRKMKRDIRDLTPQKARHYLRMYRPREWHSKASGDPKNVWLPGFVVEESPKVPRDLTPSLVTLVKEHEKEIAELKQRLDKLERTAKVGAR